MDDDAPALTAEPAPPPVPASPPAVEDSVRVIVAVEQRSVWRAGTIVIALASLAAFGWFVIDDGGSVFFTLLIAWFASIAMEPAVGRLARRMRRGAATGLVMLAVGLFGVVFAVLFGRLIADQLVQAVKALPVLAAAALDWVNQHFGTEYSQTDALSAVGITQDTLTTWAKELAGGVLGLIVSVLGAFFSMFTFLLFTFYFSADAPRLRRYVAQLFAPRWQPVVVNVWDLAVGKTGGYVSARVILATINGATTALFLFIIGMPYWLILGIWTGVVAQFVPTIGTYIAIALPVVVGLLGDNPIQGVLALIWALVYQQVENLTLEPQISAKAVSIHPAVSFASVMLGAALYGAAGAVLAIPVAALLLALLDIYARKYELLPSLTPPDTPAKAPREHSSEPRALRRGQRWVKGLVVHDKSAAQPSAAEPDG